MKLINKGIVFSNDIYRILKGNNAIGFSYIDRGMVIPSLEYIKILRKDFLDSTTQIFSDVTIVSEEEMLESMYSSISDVLNKYPIISLDKVYLDDSNILFLDCTRLDEEGLISRINYNDKDNVLKQIEAIAKLLISNNTKEIILADDVVFSGGVLMRIIELFSNMGIKVVGIRACISTIGAYRYFNNNLKEGLKCGFLMSEDVIDQICERDFYFGIAQSGISIRKNNEIYKAPYFIPYGKPNERASVPKEYEKIFSKGCLKRSINLWEEIEKLSKKEIYIKDLPEVINNTNGNEGVVKVLKKEYDKI